MNWDYFQGLTNVVGAAVGFTAIATFVVSISSGARWRTKERVYRDSLSQLPPGRHREVVEALHREALLRVVLLDVHPRWRAGLFFMLLLGSLALTVNAWFWFGEYLAEENQPTFRGLVAALGAEAEPITGVISLFFWWLTLWMGLEGLGASAMHQRLLARQWKNGAPLPRASVDLWLARRFSDQDAENRRGLLPLQALLLSVAASGFAFLAGTASVGDLETTPPVAGWGLLAGLTGFAASAALLPRTASAFARQLTAEVYPGSAGADTTAPAPVAAEKPEVPTPPSGFRRLFRRGRRRRSEDS